MLYSAGDAIITALKVKYPLSDIGFDWSSLEVVKAGNTYLFLDYAATSLKLFQDASLSSAVVGQTFNLYVIFKNELKATSAYDNYKALMTIELDIMQRIINSGHATDFEIDRQTTYQNKGLPFNLPRPFYSSRIDFTV